MDGLGCRRRGILRCWIERFGNDGVVWLAVRALRGGSRSRILVLGGEMGVSVLCVFRRAGDGRFGTCVSQYQPVRISRHLFLYIEALAQEQHSPWQYDLCAVMLQHSVFSTRSSGTVG